MAVTRAKKKEQVEKLGSDLKNVSSVIVATYTKQTVAKDFELRKTLRSTGAKYRVVKNTLAERAGKGTRIEEALKNLQGVTSIAYTSGDPVALAKVLSKYAKDNPEFTFKAGVVEGRVGHQTLPGGIFEYPTPDMADPTTGDVVDCSSRR